MSAPPPGVRRVAAGVAGAAALIAAVTVLARIVGFGRWFVFSQTVGATCLGTAYSTANMIPNIVFEVVAGGALASAVVPLVAGALARADRQTAAHTASALLTWSVVVLVPLSVLGMLVADPVMRLLVREPQGCATGSVVAVAARMFVVFAPQIALYGIAVVCGGILNAHRRFAAPAAAPLVSSLVVIATYLAFAQRWSGDNDRLDAVPLDAQRLLSVGTTLGVLALALTMAGPVAALRLGLRPTLRFPLGMAAQARRLALAGVAGLIAQQVSVVVVIVLTNGVGGALNVYNFAWAVYLLPYAVLAVPIATSAFTALSEHGGRGDEAAFARTTAATTRAVVLVSLLGAAVLAGTAAPVARMFLAGSTDTPPWQMAWALVGFAPGLVGYGLVALLGRVLYARHAGRAAAVGTVLGWVVVSLASIGVVAGVPPAWTVPGIGAANSLGMLVAGALLLAATARRAGRAAVAGLPRASAAGLLGAVLGAAAGAGVAAMGGPGGVVASTAVAAGAAVVSLIVYVAVVLLLDGSDLRTVLTRRFARD